MKLRRSRNIVVLEQEKTSNTYLQMVDGIGSKVFGWNDNFDDLLHEVSAQLIECDLLAVLDRDDDGVNTCRHACAAL